MGDVDLISLGGRFDGMCEALRANGYAFQGKGAQSHDQYTRNGALLEPHRFFASGK